MKLLVGLGNPGPEYELTRHNLGFLVMDALAERVGARWGRIRFHAEVAEASVGGEKWLLLKPQTFMNLSGSSVAEAAAFFKVAWEDVLVAHDDLDLAFGRIKIKIGGSDGGHRGIRSLLQHAPNAFVRARLGVGRPALHQDAADYVLHPFLAPEAALLDDYVVAAAAAVELWAKDGLVKALNRYNGRALVELPPEPTP